jgi:hypothetical protein
MSFQVPDEVAGHFFILNFLVILPVLMYKSYNKFKPNIL